MNARHLLAALACLLPASAALAGDLPDPQLTPGVISAALTKDKLCAKSFRTGSVRNVSGAVKRQAYAAYNLTPNKPPCPCEIDHLISLEIAGANDLRNLWPQSYATKPWNAHVKDKLENRLHKLVCAGVIDLETAQRDIAADWTAAYLRYFGAPQ